MTVIDEYLAHVTPSQKIALEHIRTIVKGMAPDAEEVISYGMPAFKQGKQYLLFMGAFKDHLSLYPGSGTALDSLSKELQAFRSSKGTLQFTEQNPIPDVLVEELIRAKLQA